MRQTFLFSIILSPLQSPLRSLSEISVSQMFAILNNFILIFSPCFYYTFWKLKNSLVYVSSKIYTAGEKSLVCSMYGRLPGALNDSYTGIHTLLLFSITLPLLTFLDFLRVWKDSPGRISWQFI